jgi:hypothetical protein
VLQCVEARQIRIALLGVCVVVSQKTMVRDTAIKKTMGTIVLWISRFNFRDAGCVDLVRVLCLWLFLFSAVLLMATRGVPTSRNRFIYFCSLKMSDFTESSPEKLN